MTSLFRSVVLLIKIIGMEKSLGTLLRECRHKRNLLLREVAAAIGIDQAILSKYETDKRLPTKEQVALLSKFYEDTTRVITIAYLSDKMAEELKDEDLAFKVMQVAEEKIKYKKINKK